MTTKSFTSSYLANSFLAGGGLVIPTFKLVTPPLAFSSVYNPSYSIFESNRTYITNYNIETERPPSGVIKYIDAVNGLDTNNGNTLATAYKSLAAAKAANANTYFIKSGTYISTATGFSNATIQSFDRNVQLIALDGPGTVRIIPGTRASEYTWTSIGGGAWRTTYRASAAFVSHINVVLDMTHSGDPTFKQLDGVTPVPVRMADRTSEALLISGGGHAVFNSAITTSLQISVKTHDGRMPDGDVYLVNHNTISQTQNQNITIFLDGVEIWSRRPISFGNNASFLSGKLIARNCGFRFSRGLGNVSIDNLDTVTFLNCHASSSVDHDGFSYNKSAGGVPIMKCNELFTHSYLNGDNSSDQGSTAHNPNVYVVRVGCTYTSNRSGFEDTLTSRSLNYGITATSNIEEGVRVTSLAETWIRNSTFTPNGISGINSSGGTYNDLGGNLF